MRLEQIISQYEIKETSGFEQSDYVKFIEAIELADEKTLHALFCEQKESIFPQAKKFLVRLINGTVSSIYISSYPSLMRLLVRKFTTQDLVTISQYRDEFGTPIVYSLFKEKITIGAMQELVSRLSPVQLKEILWIKPSIGFKPIYFTFLHLNPETCFELVQKIGVSTLVNWASSDKETYIWEHLFERKELGETCQFIIDQLEVKDLVSICKTEGKSKEETTLAASLVRHQDSKVCQALIHKLDTTALDQIFLANYGIKEEAELAHWFSYQDSITCQALLRKITPQRLIEVCHQHWCDVISSLFGKQDFATCQVFLEIVKYKGLFKIIQVLKKEEDYTCLMDLIDSNVKLSSEEKSNLKLVITNNYQFLNFPQKNIEIRPVEFISFIRETTETKVKQNGAAYVALINFALSACPKNNKEIYHQLQGLVCQLYLNLENLPNMSGPASGEEKKADWGIKASSTYRFQAHQILLRSQPYRLGASVNSLMSFGETLLICGSGGESYHRGISQAQKGGSLDSLSLPSTPDRSQNCHQVFKKGLEYILEALLREFKANENTPSYESNRAFFLSYLGLDVNETNSIALTHWLGSLKLLEEKGEEEKIDTNSPIQQKLDALEIRIKRVEQLGWDRSVQDLVCCLIQQRIARGDKAALKFNDEFLSLRFRLELAVGEAQKILSQSLVEEIRVCLQHEITRVIEQKPVLPLSAFYIESLQNFILQIAISCRDSSLNTLMRFPLESKTIAPLVKKSTDSEETESFAGLILELDQPVIKFSPLLPIHSLFKEKIYAEVCLKLLDDMDERDLISFCQYENNQKETLLHLLSTEKVAVALIEKLPPEQLGNILLQKNAQGQSVTEIVFLNFPGLHKLIIAKLSSETIVEIGRNGENPTILYDFFRKDPIACMELLNQLPADELEKACQRRFRKERYPTLVHLILALNNLHDMTSYQVSFINKLSVTTLLACDKGCSFDSLFATVFGSQNFTLCQTLISKMEAIIIIKKMSPFEISENGYLEEKEKAILTDCRFFLEEPCASVKQKPNEFILFLRERLRTWRSHKDAQFMIELMQSVLPGINDQAIRSSLLILIAKLYLSIQSGEKETKISKVSYREKAHHILLSIKQSEQIKLDSQELVTFGKSLIIASSGGGEYLRAIKNITTGSELPSCRSLLRANCHRIRRKGFEFLTAALQQTAEAKEGSPDYDTFQAIHFLFLSYLAPEKEEQLKLELRDWLIYQKKQQAEVTQAEQGDGHEDNRFTIEERLSALESWAQRVETAEGWMLFNEALVNFIIEASNQQEEELSKELSLLKYHYEIAVGMKEDKHAGGIMLKIQERISQQLDRTRNSTTLIKLDDLKHFASSVHPLPVELPIVQESSSKERLFSDLTTSPQFFTIPAEAKVNTNQKKGQSETTDASFG